MTDTSTVFESEKPDYGKNYGLGWIGFNHTGNLMSRGVAHFSRWDKTSDITVSHVFVVTGEDECVEAIFPDGVVTSSLNESYFEPEDRMVVFRKPEGLTSEVAENIVRTAKGTVGTNFDFGELASHMINDNFLGWVLNRVFRDKLAELVDYMMSTNGRWICSELAAYCLQQQPQYQDRGVLSNSLGVVTPQQLFEDEELFERLSLSQEEPDEKN